MERVVLLAQLRSLLATAPDFSRYSSTSSEHSSWLARSHALIARWDRLAAGSIASATDFMHMAITREGNIAKVFNTIHRAIADLEAEFAPDQGIALAGGATYDFFRELSRIMRSAQTSLFVVDPYLDESIFDRYLQGLPSGVSLRLLANKYGPRLQAALSAFSSQHGQAASIRTSASFHDRVIFIDGLSCWVLGQSIKDAAAAKPTYLLPVSADIAALKLTHYEAIWNEATPL